MARRVAIRSNANSSQLPRISKGKEYTFTNNSNSEIFEATVIQITKNGLRARLQSGSVFNWITIADYSFVEIQ